MTDRQTLRKVLMTELRMSGIEDDVDRAIIDSLRFNRRYRFWFNIGTAEHDTVADQYSYALPTDYLSIVGDVYYTASGGSVRTPMMELTVDELEASRGVYEGGTSIASTPRAYACDGTSLLVSPAPSVDDETIDYRYHKDLGVPTYAYDGSAWVFREPDGDPLQDDYTNDFLVHASELVRTRAAYYLHTDNFPRPERAQASLQRWLEALAQLRAESTRRRRTRVIHGRFS